jgi:hypothetical protein
VPDDYMVVGKWFDPDQSGRNLELTGCVHPAFHIYDNLIKD